MNIIFGILALIGIAGVGVAIYEHRKKRTLLAHDLNKNANTGVHPEDDPLHLTIHKTGPRTF